MTAVVSIFKAILATQPLKPTMKVARPVAKASARACLPDMISVIFVSLLITPTIKL